MPQDDLIGSREACRILNIDRSTLSRRVALGKIAPAKRLGDGAGAFLFKRADVEALARSASVGAA